MVSVSRKVQRTKFVSMETQNNGLVLLNTALLVH